MRKLMNYQVNYDEIAIIYGTPRCILICIFLSESFRARFFSAGATVSGKLASSERSSTKVGWTDSGDR